MPRTQAERPSHHHLTDDDHQDQAAARTIAAWKARLSVLPANQAAKEWAEMERGVRAWCEEINAANAARRAPVRPVARPALPARRTYALPAARRRPSPSADDDTPGAHGIAHVHEALAELFASLAGGRRLPCPHRGLMFDQLGHITFAQNTVRCVACERDGVRLANLPSVPWADVDGHRWTDGRATARAMRLAA